MKKRNFWRGYTVAVVGLSVALVFLLSGCSSMQQRTAVIEGKHIFTVEVVDQLPITVPSPYAVAVTRTALGSIHEILILRDYYPECVTHEVRHVIERDWHGDRPTPCN